MRTWAMLNPGSAASIGSQLTGFTADGVDGVLVPQIWGPPWPALAAAAATSELQVASGIAMAFVRSPTETAMAALDVDRLSGGRFTLGLGTSVRGWNESRFGVDYDRPLARLREVVTIVRALTSVDGRDGLGRFDGDFFTVDVRGARMPTPVRPSLPIWLAPLRARMIELCGEVADGILGHPVWSPHWISTEVPAALERGLARAGRKRDDVVVCPMVRIAIDDDVDRAIADAKLGLPMYASLAQYDSYFAAHGFADEARALQRLTAEGAPLDELVAAISDDMVRAFVLVGPAADVAAQLEALRPYVDEVCLTPPNGLSRDRTVTYWERIAQHLIPLA